MTNVFDAKKTCKDCKYSHNFKADDGIYIVCKCFEKCKANISCTALECINGTNHGTCEYFKPKEKEPESIGDEKMSDYEAQMICLKSYKESIDYYCEKIEKKLESIDRVIEWLEEDRIIKWLEKKND